jgi:hypothetical protein
MRVFSRAIAISMTDLMCCSFGSAFLLLLIVSSASPERRGAPRITTSSLMVRCFHWNGPKAEVRIEYLRPGEAQWRRAESLYPSGFAFSASAESTSGAEALAVLFAPSPGVWEFRARVVALARDSVPGEPLTLRFESSGDRQPLVEYADRVVKWPGNRTSPISVNVVAE